ncbi:MAG: CinA family protein [Anaerolineales bacterium]|nr:CinA family protein [Anaerolineales bacterium]
MTKTRGELLKERELLLAVAESCTGGLLSSQITDVPGSSDYFVGGIVAYSNAVKEQLLGVDRLVLEKVGAVSKEVALAMAIGVCKRLNADIGIGITGIAGPGGEMPGKPVGLVYIALSAKSGAWCNRYCWDGDRLSNKEQSVKAAFDLLQDYLDGKLA